MSLEIIKIHAYSQNLFGQKCKLQESPGHISRTVSGSPVVKVRHCYIFLRKNEGELERIMWENKGVVVI